jgi:hypothetical protein
MDILLPGVNAPIHKKAVWSVLASLPAAASLKLQFLQAHGRLPDLRDPKTFSEKIIWRKLNEEDALFATISDKVRVKDHVREKIGERWVIPHYWAGTELPPRAERDWPLPWIVKANHASGWNYIVVRRDQLDWDLIEEKVGRWVTTPWPNHRHENFCDRFPRQALFEQLVGTPGQLSDYKFFVFQGRVHFVQVDIDRRTAHKRVFFDRDWTCQPFTINTHPAGAPDLPRPRHFDAMVEAAEILGRDFSFIRVDLYDLEDGPKFSEMTPTPGSGLSRFFPERYDKVFGDLWPISKH